MKRRKRRRRWRRRGGGGEEEEGEEGEERRHKRFEWRNRFKLLGNSELHTTSNNCKSQFICKENEIICRDLYLKNKYYNFWLFVDTSKIMKCLMNCKLPNFNRSLMTQFPRHVVMWVFTDNTALPDTGGNEHANTERSSMRNVKNLVRNRSTHCCK
jgi:hypothetical protein